MTVFQSIKNAGSGHFLPCVDVSVREKEHGAACSAILLMSFSHDFSFGFKFLWLNKSYQAKVFLPGVKNTEIAELKPPSQ